MNKLVVWTLVGGFLFSIFTIHVQGRTLELKNQHIEALTAYSETVAGNLRYTITVLNYLEELGVGDHIEGIINGEYWELPFVTDKVETGEAEV